MMFFFIHVYFSDKNKIKNEEKEFKINRNNFIYNFQSINKILLFNNKIIDPTDWKLIIKNRFNDEENIILKDDIYYTIKEIVKSNNYEFIDKNIVLTKT